MGLPREFLHRHGREVVEALRPLGMVGRSLEGALTVSGSPHFRLSQLGEWVGT